MTINLRDLLTRKPKPSPELEDARVELMRTQHLLEVTKIQTEEVESVAQRMEKERTTNHFGQALSASWARRIPPTTPQKPR